MSALWALQMALVDRLKADLAVEVYDGEAPQSAPAPYVVVGDAPTETPRGYFGTPGFDERVYLHIWSRYRGAKEAMSILVDINTALKAPLAVPGFGSAVLDYEFGTVLVDGESRHLPARYSILVLEGV